GQQLHLPIDGDARDGLRRHPGLARGEERPEGGEEADGEAHGEGAAQKAGGSAPEETGHPSQGEDALTPASRTPSRIDHLVSRRSATRASCVATSSAVPSRPAASSNTVITARPVSPS